MKVTKKSGLVAKKIGMSRVYDEKGIFIPVTILQVEDNVVVEHKTTEKDGYSAIKIATGVVKEKKLSKPVLGIFKKLGVEPKAILKEFRIQEDSLPEVGASLKADHFMVNQFVDVSGTSLGKGFAGVIKRHNFKMNDASHGNSRTHRSHGSTGQRQDPGKVFKGKKMAGHLGNERVTVQNLRVIEVDAENRLLIVKGAVPGYKGALVYVKDAVKKVSLVK